MRIHLIKEQNVIEKLTSNKVVTLCGRDITESGSSVHFETDVDMYKYWSLDCRCKKCESILNTSEKTEQSEVNNT